MRFFASRYPWVQTLPSRPWMLAVSIDVPGAVLVGVCRGALVPVSGVVVCRVRCVRVVSCVRRLVVHRFVIMCRGPMDIALVSRGPERGSAPLFPGDGSRGTQGLAPVGRWPNTFPQGALARGGTRVSLLHKFISGRR